MIHLTVSNDNLPRIVRALIASANTMITASSTFPMDVSDNAMRCLKLAEELCFEIDLGAERRECARLHEEAFRFAEGVHDACRARYEECPKCAAGPYGYVCTTHQREMA